MGRKHTRRTMKGGFLESFSNTLSGWGSSLTQGTSSMWEKTKNATSGLTGTTTPSPTPSTPSPMTTSTYGGKRSRRRRHMRGGFKDNTPTTGIALHAASISDVKTAQPHNWVGGKTRRHRKHKRNSRRHHRH